MLGLLTEPPPAEAGAKMASRRPDGPDRTHHTTRARPISRTEAAGAVLILQGTFVDRQRAAQFWLRAAELFERLAVAPGFIRRLLL